LGETVNIDVPENVVLVLEKEADHSFFNPGGAAIVHMLERVGRSGEVLEIIGPKDIPYREGGKFRIRTGFEYRVRFRGLDLEGLTCTLLTTFRDNHLRKVR